MIVVNPNTGHRFYDAKSCIGFQATGYKNGNPITRTYKIVEEEIHYIGDGLVANRNLFDFCVRSTKFIEVNKDGKLVLYRDPEDERKIAFNILQVTFDGPWIKYEEVLMTERNLDVYNRILVNDHLHTKQEKAMFEEMVDDFEKQTENLHTREIFDIKKVVYKGMGKQKTAKVRVQQFLPPRKFLTHQSFYYENHKYQEMVNSGFAFTCSAMVDFSYQGKSKKNIDEMYEYLGGRRFDEMNEKEQEIFYGNQTDGEFVLKLFYLYGFREGTFNIYESHFHGYNNIRQFKFEIIKDVILYYEPDIEKTAGCKIISEIHRLCQMSAKEMVTIESLIDILERMRHAEVSRGEKEKAMKSSGYRELKRWVEKMEDTERDIKKERINRKLKETRDMLHFEPDDSECVDGILFKFNRIDDLGQLKKETADLFVSQVSNLNDYHLLFEVVEANSAHVAFNIVNAKTKTYQYIGETKIFEKIKTEEIANQIAEKYLNQIHLCFLNRKI